MTDSLQSKVSQTSGIKHSDPKGLRQVTTATVKTFYLLHSANFSLVPYSTFHLFWRICFQLADIKFRSAHVRHPFRRQSIHNCESHCVRLPFEVGFGQTFVGRGVCYPMERATKSSKDLMSATFFSSQPGNILPQQFSEFLSNTN